MDSNTHEQKLLDYWKSRALTAEKCIESLASGRKLDPEEYELHSNWETIKGLLVDDVSYPLTIKHCIFGGSRKPQQITIAIEAFKDALDESLVKQPLLYFCDVDNNKHAIQAFMHGYEFHNNKFEAKLSFINIDDATTSCAYHEAENFKVEAVLHAIDYSDRPSISYFVISQKITNSANVEGGKTTII